MNWLIVKNDFIRNKVINIALLLFMIFASFLAVLSIIMSVQTYTSISKLYEIAQPPHFLQMHKGGIDQTKIDEFMNSYDGLTYWQIITMIDVYGENITIVSDDNRYSLADLYLDIGLVMQNDSKDLLLDSSHKKVFLKPGEIGIPVLLKNRYGMKIGDKVIINNDFTSKEFVIKEFVLDSQMNSTMTSSTRILLSDEDFESLQDKLGEHEYLIEAYFNDSKEASNFQIAYENANLSKNGPAITYTIIFLLSALTDIVTVFVLMFVSFLLIIISFICIKFTIMASIEEEIREIGTMKAIGLKFVDIREIYLSKYRILAMVGVTLGLIFAILFSSFFTKHISETFGNLSLLPTTIILAIAIGTLIFIIINYYCKKVLKKIRKVTVVDALVNGNGFEKQNNVKRDGLYKSKKLSVNWIMGTREVVYKFKSWIIVFAIVLISEMMILIPVNFLNTFEAPEFITYMGSSLEDILIEVDNGDNIENNYFKVKQVLQNDDSIQNIYENSRVSVKTTDSNNEFINLHIDSGSNSGSGLKYLSGLEPLDNYEIALSYLNAEKIGKSTGDKIALLFNGDKEEFTISGIYQDVTNGGYTAKSKFNFLGLNSEKYTFSINLLDSLNVEEKAKQLSKVIGSGVSIDPMDEFINQTLGGVSKQLKAIVSLIVLIGISMVVLITVLFLKLRLAKDVSSIAILKAIGFSKKDITQQYLIKIGQVSLFGIVMGVILTSLIGEKFVNLGLSMAGLGISKVELIENPLIQYIFCPLFLLVSILLVTKYVVGTIDKYNIISLINE